MSVLIVCLDAYKILSTMKSLMEWYILHSLLHTKFLTTVSSNFDIHKHSIFSFNKLSLITQLPFPGKVRILSKRGGALTKLCGMGHIWTIYGYDMG